MLDRAIDFLLAMPGLVWIGLKQYAKDHPLATGLAILAFLRTFGTTVQTGTAGVLFSFGRAKKVLEPGFHPLIPIFQQVRHTPIRSVALDLPRQRVATGDGLVYDVHTNVVYRVENPIQAAVAIDDVRQGVLTLLPLLVHDLLREQTRESLAARQQLDHELTERARQALARWGVTVETAGMSTIAPTRPTVRLTQLPARVTERAWLLKWQAKRGVDVRVAAALTTAGRAPLGRAAARYRRHRMPGVNEELASSRVTVVLPDGARLVVNDVEVAVFGTRVFDTPRLERDRKYAYKMTMRRRIHGIDVIETRRVEVTAGKSVRVDFTQPDPANALGD
jgi:uncharacterized protein (TIGR03000 family)